MTYLNIFVYILIIFKHVHSQEIESLTNRTKALTTLAICLPNFPRQIQQQRYHGRVLVAVNDEAHLIKPRSEVASVVSQLPNSTLAFGGAEIEMSSSRIC